MEGHDAHRALRCILLYVFVRALVHMHVHMHGKLLHLCVHMHVVSVKARTKHRTLAEIVIGCCELPDMDAGNQA